MVRKTAYNPCAIAMDMNAVDLDAGENHCSCEHAHADVEQRVRGAFLLAAEQSLQLEFVLQMFQVDEQQHQTCSWWGAVVPAAVFVLQMARNLVPCLIAASQYVPDAIQQRPTSGKVGLEGTHCAL